MSVGQGNVFYFYLGALKENAHFVLLVNIATKKLMRIKQYASTLYVLAEQS